MINRAYWIAFVVCAAAATVPLLMTPTPPGVDLPQHMAQVALWKHFDDACQRFGDVYYLTFSTPYLAAYAIARLLATVVTVTTAIRITMWMSVMLLPLALRLLLTRGKGDEWLSLLGFPLAYGYAFYWGFFNFNLAVPVGVAFLALLFDRRPRDLSRTLLAILLVLTHGVVFVFCTFVTVAVAIARRSVRPLLALIPAAAAIAMYVGRVRQAEPLSLSVWTWDASPQRFIDLSSLLFSNSWELWGFPLVVLIAVAIAVTRPRITRDPARWALFAVAAMLYFLAPSGAMANAFIFQRFAVMVPVATLFLFDEPRRAHTLSRAIVIAIVLGWMSVLAVRFAGFAEESRPFEKIVDAIPPARRVLLFEMRPNSDHLPGLQYRHYGALVQVRRGGLSAWSFSATFPQIVRYRPGAEPRLKAEPWVLMGVDWPGVLQYDYVMVRGSDPRLWLFRNAPAPLALREHSGDWWLFETPRARTQHRDCRPLNE